MFRIKNEDICNIRRSVGVYLIRCIPLGKIYIGSTKQSFRARFSNHCKFLRQGKLANLELQTDFNTYGEENFEFEILFICEEEETVEKERFFIEELKPQYNKIKANNNSKTNTGKKFSDEHKNKIREKSKNFRHKDIELITKQNKDGANKFIVINLQTKEETHINSKLELEEFLQLPSVERFYNKEVNGYYVNLLKTQRKSVKLFVDDEWVSFNSFEKCDKFLNKWRGFTSTKYLKNVKELESFQVIFND